MHLHACFETFKTEARDPIVLHVPRQQTRGSKSDFCIFSSNIFNSSPHRGSYKRSVSLREELNTCTETNPHHPSSAYTRIRWTALEKMLYLDLLIPQTRNMFTIQSNTFSTDDRGHCTLHREFNSWCIVKRTNGAAWYGMALLKRTECFYVFSNNKMCW